jgi:hypothetical protein
MPIRSGIPISIPRSFRELSKKAIRKAFEGGQSIGLNILPMHFFSGIPDLRELKAHEDWKKPRRMFGISGKDITSQLSFIRECCRDGLNNRLKSLDIYDACRRENGEDGYGSAEADFLYCFIFSKQPKRILQVGAGLSTAVILLAAREADYRPEIICIDPYPNSFLIRSHQEGLIKLIGQKAQTLGHEFLTKLGEDGLLFIDSTHTVKPGSEVNLIILEVLPRLKRGHWVHFHDIYFPYDYSRDILGKGLFFPNESVLLQAFLIGNPRFSIMASLGMLHYADPKKLQEYLPRYQPAKHAEGLSVSPGDFPSALYLQVVE